jgi:hypothetical protein
LPKALALLLCLALSAAADDCGGRPCLDVWTLDGPNDRAFWTAYETDQAFRDAIDGAFFLRRIPIRQQPLAAITRGIRGGPTFAVPGRQLIYGFRGTDVLLAELGLPRIERSAPEDRQTLPPPQPIDVEELRRSIASDLARTINETEQRLRSATDRQIAEALSRQLDSLSELQRQVQDLQTGSDQTGADRRLLQGIAATVRDLQERRSPPPDDAEQPPPSDRLSSPSVSDSALRLFGASVSLTQLLLAGGAIAGAPPAAWLTLAAIKRLRHRRSTRPSDHPQRQQPAPPSDGCQRCEREKLDIARHYQAEIARLQRQIDQQQATPHREGGPPPAAPFPRDLDEARQLRELREFEGRVPELDSLRGMLFDDAVSSQLSEFSPLTDEQREAIEALKREIDRRVEQIAPPSVKPYLQDTAHA